MQARYAPTELKVDTSKLSAGDKKALLKLLEAARVLDPLFMAQIYVGNNELYTKLKKDATPLGRARLKYFWQNKGPWSDLDGHDAFLPDVPGGTWVLNPNWKHFSLPYVSATILTISEQGGGYA